MYSPQLYFLDGVGWELFVYIKELTPIIQRLFDLLKYWMIR